MRYDIVKLLMDIPALTEPDVTRQIFSSVQLYANAMYFIESSAIGHSKVDWKIEAHICVSRSELGLPPNQKPGDIDLLLIPIHRGKRFAAKSMAIEVKKFYVPQSKRGKSPNQYGSSQTKGLLFDGFPFVGLLHVPLIQPSRKLGWKVVPEIGNKLAGGKLQIVGDVTVDIESYSVSQRHYGRFQHFELDKSVGYNSFSLSLDDTCSQITGHTVSDYHVASENPQIDESLIESLRKFDRLPEFVIEHEVSGVTIRTSNLD